MRSSADESKSLKLNNNYTMKRNVRVTHLILLFFGIVLVTVGGILALLWPSIFKMFLAKVST